MASAKRTPSSTTTPSPPAQPSGAESLAPAAMPPGELLGQLLRLFDGLTDACLVAELDGRMRYANEAARDLLRINGRATGRKLSAVLAERHALEVVEDAAASGRPRTAVRALTFSSDGPRSYTVSAVPFVVEGEGTFLRVALCAGKNHVAGSGNDESRSMLEKLGDPLSIIQGYLENLLDGAIKDPAIMRQCLSAMQRQATAMQRVMNTLRV